MKLKRNTALLLAGALALTAVPMNVFAYTGNIADAYDNEGASQAETKKPSSTNISVSAKISSTTTVNGRTLLVAGKRTNDSIENGVVNTEYEAPAPYIQLTVDHDNEELDTDIVYKLTLSNGEFINMTSSSAINRPINGDSRINGYFNGTTTQGAVDTLANTYTMPKGVIFEYVSKTEAYIILDHTRIKETLEDSKAGISKFNIPLIARTTSESTPLTVTADGRANGLSISGFSNAAATTVVGINNDAGFVAVDSSVSRNTIRPTFKFTEYSAGNFKPEGYISINFNNGMLPAATNKIENVSGNYYTQEQIQDYFRVSGFGIDTSLSAPFETVTVKGVVQPTFLRRNDTELWVNMAAFGKEYGNGSFITTENGLHAETLKVEVELNREAKRFVEVTAKADWDDLVSSTKLSAGAFSDYDYTFTTAKDTSVSGFKYPVLLGNRGFTVETYEGYGLDATGNKEGETNEDYKVLDIVITDTVDNAILWNNREFDIEFSSNVRLRGYEIVKAEHFINPPNVDNFSFLDDEELSASVKADSFKSGSYTNVLHYDGLNEVNPLNLATDGELASITLRVYVDNNTYKSGDITAKMTGNAIAVDSDEIKVGEILQSMDLTADVQSLNQIAGPQPSGSITVTELVPGQINEDELYYLTLVSPGYLDSATSTWGFYDGDIDLVLDVDGVDKDDNVSDISVGTTSNFGAIEVDLEGLTESDTTDELRSFTVSDVNIVIGTLFTVPSFEFEVKLTSELKDTPATVYENLYGVKGYKSDITDQSVDKKITVEYLNAESANTGGAYADYISTFSKNYNDDISMTIGQDSFTAMNKDGEAITGTYTVEGNSPALYVPKLVGDDTYVSLRSFAQAIGGDVTWIQETQTACIYPQGYEAYVASKGSRAAVSYANPSVVEFKEPGKDVVTLEIKNQVGNGVSVLTIDDVNHLPLRFFAENIYKVKGIDVSDFASTKTFVIDAK